MVVVRVVEAFVEVEEVVLGLIVVIELLVGQGRGPLATAACDGSACIASAVAVGLWLSSCWRCWSSCREPLVCAADGVGSSGGAGGGRGGGGGGGPDP